VRDFYDTYGWHKYSNGTYKDTTDFVDNRPVLKNYNHRMHLRVKRYIKPYGEYFLDAGSGAIPHAEYIEYSSGYKRRVCVDISEKALSEARSKLKDKGLYVVADLTKLPFKDGIFDASICAHVLYHIPQDEQKSAVEELYRTLKKDSICVIIYMWPGSILMKFVSASRAFIEKLKHLVSIVPGTRFIMERLTNPGKKNISNRDKGEEQIPPPLYCQPNDYQWFRETLPKDWITEILCWRSFDRVFSRIFVVNNFLGRILLDLIFTLENNFSRTLGKIGRHPMIIIKKK